jgi:hypothetical protein
VWDLNALSDEGELVDRARETSSLRSDRRLGIHDDISRGVGMCRGLRVHQRFFASREHRFYEEDPLLWVLGRLADWFV